MNFQNYLNSVQDRLEEVRQETDKKDRLGGTLVEASVPFLDSSIQDPFLRDVVKSGVRKVGEAIDQYNPLNNFDYAGHLRGLRNPFEPESIEMQDFASMEGSRFAPSEEEEQMAKVNRLFGGSVEDRISMYKNRYNNYLSDAQNRIEGMRNQAEGRISGLQDQVEGRLSGLQDSAVSKLTSGLPTDLTSSDLLKNVSSLGDKDLSGILGSTEDVLSQPLKAVGGIASKLGLSGELGEGALDSLAEDEDPFNFIITAGLGLGSLIAGIKEEDSPIPTIARASAQFGVNE